ncbi:MAG: DUF4346 domain-containing protein [Elainellaceae cyanobacterium]
MTQAIEHPLISATRQLDEVSKHLAETMTALDHELSNRDIELDPAGYFLIYLDSDRHLICAAHYSNNINDQGEAIDPETGEPIPCDRPSQRQPTKIYTGRTAKEIGIAITETANPCPLTRFEHALYLGREFVRAEIALLTDQPYLQD